MGRAGYPDEIKMQVVQQWLTLGNIKLVAANLDVPIPTIKHWRGEPWWKDYENEIRAGRRFAVDKKLSNIIDKAFVIMDDRLQHGDWIFDQIKGEVVRRPVGFKDASVAASNLLQRQQILEQQSKDEYTQDATKSIQDQLALLAAEFAKFNGKSKTSAEIISFKEVNETESQNEPEFKEITDAVSEEWSSQLQEGSSSLYESPVCGEEEGGAEQSETDDGEEGIGT